MVEEVNENPISPEEYDLIQKGLKKTGHVTIAIGMLVNLRASGGANTVRLKEIYGEAIAYDPEAGDHEKYILTNTAAYNYLLKNAEKFGIKTEQD